MFDFITDLDEFFCEKYAGYDKLTVLPGYKMPVMQASKTDEFGRTYAYTLPAETMRLSAQENKAELLEEFKKKEMEFCDGKATNRVIELINDYLR